MSEDDLCFVWNCCDALEKAKERETVLRIANELRERFSPPVVSSPLDGRNLVFTKDAVYVEAPAPYVPWTGYQGAPEAPMPALCVHEGFSHTSNVACPMPAPESGVEFPAPYGTPDESPGFNAAKPLKPLALKEDRTPEQLRADGDEERPDLNDSDEFDVEQR